MKIQKMKIPTILGALLVAGTLSAGAQMNSDSLYKELYRPHSSVSPDSLRWFANNDGRGIVSFFVNEKDTQVLP